MDVLTRELVCHKIVSGDWMRDLLKILPELEESFVQRKCYDEYYFKNTTIHIEMCELNALTQEFRIVMFDCQEIHIASDIW